MEDIRGKFEQIEYTRHASYVEHNLADVLIMGMGAVMSGITELADMMVYFTSKADFYRERFGIEKHPSKPTSRRIFNMIDGDLAGRTLLRSCNKTLKI